MFHAMPFTVSAPVVFITSDPPLPRSRLSSGRGDKAKVIEGSALEAKSWALAANFQHFKNGATPSKGDQKTAYVEMCALYKDTFGYNASKVVSLLESWGMAQGSERWMRQCTKEVRDQIKVAQEAEIDRLDREGHTRDEIAEEVGCSTGTVSGKLKALRQKRNSSEIDEEPEADLPPPFEPTEVDSPEYTGFDEVVIVSKTEQCQK